MENIYIVNSYTDTVPGKLIKFRAKLKFWNRYAGDIYSHVSLSRDSKLNNMISFARKEINNPFIGGIVKEDIRTKIFALNKEKSIISVMELPVSAEQYEKIDEIIEYYWSRRDELKFNFAGLASMLFCGRGVTSKDRFFCSQWVATVLKEAGLDLFNGKEPHNIRPFDFYGLLKENIIYEGLATDYPEYNLEEQKVNIKKK